MLKIPCIICTRVQNYSRNQACSESFCHKIALFRAVFTNVVLLVRYCGIWQPRRALRRHVCNSDRPSPERVCSCGARVDAPKSVRPSPGCFFTRHLSRPYFHCLDSVAFARPPPRPHACHLEKPRLRTLHPNKPCPHNCRPEKLHQHAQRLD